ncbi:SpoIIE family protein phosphatase [Nocardioides sp. zg-1230]|uniref:PP2C family protein-serine/threonine phosphatase n=1 Tax=Nocardioides sp. zg-1230 TaxID=2736601 RepID=UPI001556EAB0|nr:SpoIIE family protein phosphatase [Nocardioides sp. zg-1230]
MSRLDDPARLAAVESLVAFGDRDDRFDRVVRMARRLFDVPVAAVNLVDDRQQVSLAQVGLTSSVRPVSESLCAVAVIEDRPVVLPDAREDPELAQHPAVVSDEPAIFYAGRPLRADGHVVGTLCLADDRPRELSEAEDRMLGDLAAWVEQELDRDRDQREAREVQRRLLPRQDVRVPGLEIAGHCQPARSVGGDFYDWQALDGRLQVVLADVMGKGLVAAMIAAQVRTLVRGTSPFNSVAATVTRAAVDSQDDLDDAGTFVTLFAVRIDPRSGEMEYVDAGHGLAFVLQPDGDVRRLASGDLPLGAMAGDDWTARSGVLAPGETLLAVSDGVLDAFASAEDALAAARDLAAQTPDPATIVELVTERVSELTTSDDLTVIAVRRETT